MEYPTLIFEICPEIVIGIDGVLFAAPIADAIAVIVILALTITFFRDLNKEVVVKETETPVIKSSHEGTIITIAREHGTAGKQIGKLMALMHVNRSNECREVYYRNISGQEWRNPHNYDLCLDASIGREECAGMVCNYYKNKNR